MKISRLIYSTFIGFTLYLSLLLIYGETGLSAIKKVESYKELLNLNLNEIQEINEELTVEFNSLSSDNELIKLKARALGYFAREDHIVHISNWNPDINCYNPGHVFKEEYLTEINYNKFRICGFSVSFIVYIFLFLINQRRKQL